MRHTTWSTCALFGLIGIGAATAVAQSTPGNNKALTGSDATTTLSRALLEEQLRTINYAIADLQAKKKILEQVRSKLAAAKAKKDVDFDAKGLLGDLKAKVKTLKEDMKDPLDPNDKNAQNFFKSLDTIQWRWGTLHRSLYGQAGDFFSVSPRKSPLNSARCPVK